MKQIKELFVGINENEIITKFLYREITFEEGKSTWTIRKENFNEETDFDTAISIDIKHLNNIQLDVSNINDFIEKGEDENAIEENE